MKRALAIVLAVSLIALGAPLHAQGKGSITGTAKNSSGNIIPNQTVQLRNLSNGQVVAATKTDGSGAFAFTNLAPGNYVVEIVDSSAKVLGVTPAIAVTTSQVAATGVTVIATAAGGAAAATATAGGVGAFFSSKAGILMLVGAGAGITVAIIAAGGNGSPSK